MTVNTPTAEQQWYFTVIESPSSSAVSVDQDSGTVTYDSRIRSDESHAKPAQLEELVHATTIGLLCSSAYNYPVEAIGHEIHFAHGSRGSNADEVDVIVYDSDDLPFALVELKSHHEFEREKYRAIQYQLFGTAPLAGAPRLLVYATVEPKGAEPSFKAICIDYTKYKTFEAWRNAGEPHSTDFPKEYRDLVLSQLGFGICLRKGPIELSCLVGSVDGGGGNDGQGQIRGAAGTGTTGRAPATDPGWQKLSPSDR